MKDVDWDFTINLIVAVLGICAIFFFMKSGVVQKNESDNLAMVKMVGDGADPIAARCAIKGSGTQDKECAVYTALKSASVKE